MNWQDIKVGDYIQFKTLEGVWYVDATNAEKQTVEVSLLGDIYGWYSEKIKNIKDIAYKVEIKELP